MCGLTSMSIPELAGLMEELGQPKFRARQVFEWISRGKRPQEMTNLPKELRDKLDTLHYGGASIYDKRVSAKDGTIKYLFQLEDGNIVEGVLMSYHYGNTMCISTQVGCRMGCAGDAQLYRLRRKGRTPWGRQKAHRHKYSAHGQRRAAGQLR